MTDPDRTTKCPGCWGHPDADDDEIHSQGEALDYYAHPCPHKTCQAPVGRGCVNLLGVQRGLHASRTRCQLCRGDGYVLLRVAARYLLDNG